MAFLVATTSLPAVYRPNGYAQTTTAGTPHARANTICGPFMDPIGIGFVFLENWLIDSLNKELVSIT